MIAERVAAALRYFEDLAIRLGVGVGPEAPVGPRRHRLGRSTNLLLQDEGLVAGDDHPVAGGAADSPVSCRYAYFEAMLLGDGEQHRLEVQETVARRGRR
jgi:hypothetical protein